MERLITVTNAIAINARNNGYENISNRTHKFSFVLSYLFHCKLY